MLRQSCDFGRWIYTGNIQAAYIAGHSVEKPAKFARAFELPRSPRGSRREHAFFRHDGLRLIDRGSLKLRYSVLEAY